MKNKNIKNLTIGMIISAVMVCGYIGGISASVSAEPANANQQVIKISPVMEEYIAKTRRSIKGNWYPPAAHFQNVATVTVTVNKKGEMTNCSLTEPSPSEEFNNALIDAVKKTKYAPLPAEFPDNSADLTFTFGMHKRSILK